MNIWFAVGLMLPASAFAQQAAFVHQGRLLDGVGVPLDGSFNVTLALMDDASAGSVLLTRTETVQVSDGYFSVIVADVNAELLAGDRWLAVEVANTEMLPRQPLGGVAQAIHASGAQLTDVDVVCDATTTSWHGTIRFRNDAFEGCTSTGWLPLSF
jgi:hypothetical protein